MLKILVITKQISVLAGTLAIFFFFFEIDLCATQGTEPHVALREHTLL